MSWGGLPWWVYECEYEERVAMMLCAFPEEVASGSTHSCPVHVHQIRMNK